ncbi:MAG: hypothetical protein JWP44_4543, partial [Mucilaginibacter sp.]|nr:hypothetical protein [Mucilaginibacter sp.]
MSEWKCGAKRGLDVDEDSAWDGSEAKKAIFEWAGWPDSPDSAKARQAFLAYDAEADQLKGSYKLPFCTVKDGKLTAVRHGLDAAASRLPQTDDLPEAVRNEAGDVLDSYAKDESDEGEGGRARQLTYSRVMRIDTRASNAAADEDLLSIAKQRAADPSVFDEFPPFIFPAEISSNRWDARDTRMMPSSLKNYAADAAAGVAFLRNHNTYDDPAGHSLAGTFTGGQGNGLAKARASFFVLPDPDNAGYVNKIRSGTVRDVSIGFYDGEWLCTICGKDMNQWMSRDGCPHFLGVTYTPRDESGMEKGTPQKARANIENAHLAEVSGVYDGATPGAMIDKARALAGQGELDSRTRELVQVRYNIKLPGGSRIHAVPDLGRPTAEEDNGMEPEAQIAALEKRVKQLEGELTVAQGGLKPLEAVRATLTPLLPADHPGHADAAEAVRWLVEERTRLVPLADEGRAYRVDLIEDARKEGVRAHGKDFKEEMWTGILTRSSIEEIKEFRAMWAREAAERFPG